MGFVRRELLVGFVILFCLPGLAQQADISKYTLFTGFDYLDQSGKKSYRTWIRKRFWSHH